MWFVIKHTWHSMPIRLLLLELHWKMNRWTFFSLFSPLWVHTDLHYSHKTLRISYQIIASKFQHCFHQINHVKSVKPSSNDIALFWKTHFYKMGIGNISSLSLCIPHSSKHPHLLIGFVKNRMSSALTLATEWQ